MKKVSIIIPVYNVEQYLKATLDSVKNQTYRNLEIILVDDGSTDSSPSICEEYAAVDDRFIVYHKDNGGVSTARNVALDKITGEYCVFIDSDDLVKDCYVEKMVEYAEKFNSGIVTCRWMNGSEHTIDNFHNYNCKEHPNATEVTFDYTYFNGRYFHSVVTCAIFATELVKKSRFSTELIVGEDTYFFAEMMAYGRRMIFVDELYYYYTFRDRSLAHAADIKNLNSRISCWTKLLDLYTNENQRFITEFFAKKAISYMNIYYEAKMSEIDKNTLGPILKEARDMRTYVHDSVGLTNRVKRKFSLFCLFPGLYVLAKNIRCRI